MSALTPTTQRDVAQACGLHPSTVCLALKNSPSIPLETRRRVQATAETLGYQPNVSARNLALLRSERKPAASLPVAWINQEARRDHWRIDPEAELYQAGARRRAEELGYHLEEIWAQEPGMTPGRMEQIVQARGIEGVLLPVHREFNFSVLNPRWSGCAVIGLNDHRLGEWVDVVCPDHHANVGTALRELRLRGQQRIGGVITRQFDLSTSGLVHGSLLRHQVDIAPAERIPVHATSVNDGMFAGLDAWVREHRPDAVVCSETKLTAYGRVTWPGIVWVQLHGSGGTWGSCIDSAPQEIGAVAVDCLIEKMRRFERGMREATRLHLVRGTWVHSAQRSRIAAAVA